MNYIDPGEQFHPGLNSLSSAVSETTPRWLLRKLFENVAKLPMNIPVHWLWLPLDSFYSLFRSSVRGDLRQKKKMSLPFIVTLKRRNSFRSKWNETGMKHRRSISERSFREKRGRAFFKFHRVSFSSRWTPTLSFSFLSFVSYLPSIVR